ncbi:MULTISPECIES: DUF2785 domain-containing protein [Leuconostoc]|uniref:DUF2785 domain-containing protein n=2 Tax=Leuconostoc kimchii TaxID=136609 RepID=D5T2I9_LEUKI|nr:MULTISPECIES: DUF2785 domain-containing protein [Leuconostoc]ADG40488.1 hypothetical protein LKI_04730 [Leuconostoc kimchii IMSNU 11154]AEJ31588.1 hypothetical protein LGMK_07695 [Leuconostoc sp. C2]QBR46958.1 DUF2785 domain-containing protein [Leuconostoc kimchii]
MTELEELQQKMINLRHKTREGEVFQSLGEAISEIVGHLDLLPVTPVLTPKNDDEILSYMQMYRQQPSEGDVLSDGLSDDTNISDDVLMAIAEQLANPTAKYRDNGAFVFLSDIIQKNLISEAQMSMLANYFVSDDQLFAHIFERANDGIYRRSFSMLMLSLLLFIQRTKKPFLTDIQLSRIIDQVALYAILERDTRGFINTNGWAHAFTHIGNVVSEIMLMPKLVRADKLFVLASMLAGYRELKLPLMMGETERLVEVVIYAANAHRLYCDYVLITLKLWRKDLVTRQNIATEANWHQLYNRTRFFHAIILTGAQNVPKSIYDYVEQTKGYLT